MYRCCSPWSTATRFPKTSSMTSPINSSGTWKLPGVHRDTILDLLNVAGHKCEALMLKMICGLKVQDVECDEVWQYIGMKSRTKAKKEITDPDFGGIWANVVTMTRLHLLKSWPMWRQELQNQFGLLKDLLLAAAHL